MGVVFCFFVVEKFHYGTKVAWALQNNEMTEAYAEGSLHRHGAQGRKNTSDYAAEFGTHASPASDRSEERGAARTPASGRLLARRAELGMRNTSLRGL